MAPSLVPVLPVNASEKGEYNILLEFKDDNDVARTPTSASWTLSKYDGTIVNSREDVTINSPASEETVKLSGNDLAILDDLELEYRIFTVQWAYGGITTYTRTAFNVENFVTVS